MSEMNSTEKKLLESIQQYYQQLATEAKKKHPPIKEACESGIVKIRSASKRHQSLRIALMNESAEIMEPFFIGCDTKTSKMVQISLNAIQKLIIFEAVSNSAADNLINCLWNLMESGVEELKLLQTITLLISTNNLVQSQSLAKALSLSFRLHFTKNSTTNNTASATIRQLVSAIFERVQTEDQIPNESNQVHDIKFDDIKSGKYTPISLRPSASDAFFFFQDLVQLVNAEQPFWLTGLTEMTRTFGLELLELIFTSFPDVFYKHEEFSFLLKERVCQLVIKLFSPNTKQRTQSLNIQQTNATLQTNDKPFWPITVRLLRIVSVLIQKFYTMLITESEIFLSLLVKSLEGDKPIWQRSMALESLYKMIQPNLISCLCRFYDMKPHSSKIFRDIVNGLCIYIQSQFLIVDSSTTQSLIASIVNNNNNSNPSLANNNSSSSLNSLNSTSNVNTLQPAFLLRGIYIPLLFNTNKLKYKPFYIEQLDKLEAPTAPEGHGLSSAFACVLEIVQSLTNVIETDIIEEQLNNVNEQITAVRNLNEETRLLHENLLNASCCGLLGAFSLLLDASTDEAITELILIKMKKLAGLYGIYELESARDAMLTSICKSSLPPNYTLSVLNITQTNESNAKQQKQLNRRTSLETTNNINITNLISQQNSQTTSNSIYLGGNDASETRQQVIAVGTPLPSASLPQSAQQGPVMLTSKNLQCMNAILSVANSHGSVLSEKSWHIILTTLQHLVWILGLKPTSGGSLKVGRAGTEAGASTNTLITTAAMSDLPVLSTMLSRLFESSQNLSSESLLHLVNALVKLSQESMDIAYNNREPSLFAVAKLLETGIVNLSRIEVIWKQITSHLLEVCSHPHIKMREWGVEALCNLVKSILSQSENKLLNEKDISKESSGSTTTVKQFMFLSPLQDLSYISHSDIRQKQLDCTLQILQSSGDTLSYGWPQIFEIVGAINETQNENLIRCAFQCLQLIIADFLALIPSVCLILCVDTTAKFGSQKQELNVSLTAIGLLWNIADYLHSNQNKIKVILDENSSRTDSDNENKFNSLNAFDTLWMGLYTRLGDLCTDSRSSVRKSAGQTLFSTLTTHGSIIESKTWKSVLWNVLFPLLDRVRALSGSASSDKITNSKLMGSGSSDIIIHHSRNTAQKQWSETQVLVLSGVSRILSIKLELLVNIEDFYKTWKLFLEFIETSALSKNSEVSISALKCFQEILCVTKTVNYNEEKNGSQSLWKEAWNVWYNIGFTTTQLKDIPVVTNSSNGGNKNSDLNSIYIPSQAFLTSLIQIFPYLFIHIKSKFSESDFQKLSVVLQNAVSVPLMNSDASLPYMMSLSMNEPLSPLQENTLFVLETLQKEILLESDLYVLLPSIFNQYLTFSCFSVNIISTHFPSVANTQITSQSISSETSTFNSNTYFAFGERAMKNALTLYQKTANEPIVVKSHILHSIIKTLKIPLCMKYSCPSQTTWKLAVNSLLTVLQIGLPVARQNSVEFIGMWGDLALSLEGFLFPTSKPASTQTLEEQQFDESLDVRVVELIRDGIMPFAAQIPKEFLLQTVSLLNKGSIHSATNSSPVDTESSRKLREEFARTCFETLLQFSFLGPKGNPGLFIQSLGSDFTPDHSIGIVNKLAVTSILQRFNEVVVKYVEDEKLCPCPLPRHRMAEISFVLKALATLIVSLKKAPIDSVEPHVWDLLIRLYPHIVDCTTSNSAQVNRSLREVLHEYSDLLRPPSVMSYNKKNGC